MMKSNSLRAILLGSLLFLAACGQGTATQGEALNLAVIVGNRANSLTLGPNEIDVASDLIRQAFEEDGNTATGHIAFIISDGNPQQVPLVDRLGRPQELFVEGRNYRSRDNQRDDLIDNTIIPFLDGAHMQAQTEEADLLQAIHMANNALRTMPSDRESHLLIIDSGITTTGQIDLTRLNIQDEDFDAQSFVDELLAQNQLPDLSDINVTFIDLGGATGALGGAAPAGSQQVPQHAVDDLQELWEEVIAASNGDLVYMSQAGYFIGRVPLLYHEAEDSLPFVSSVNFTTPESSLLIPIDESMSDEEYEKIMDSLTFYGAELGFIAYEDILRDPVNTANILRNASVFLSQYLAEDTNRYAYVVGSEAASRTPRRETLSEERAERIIQILVDEFDLPAERLHAVGGGTTILPWRNADERPNGVWNEPNGQLNRVVAIVPSFSTRVSALEEAGLID